MSSTTETPLSQDVSTTPAKLLVLFDGLCPLCQRSIRILRKLDWLKKLQFHDARDVTNIPEHHVHLEPKRLLEEMHVLTPDCRQAFAGYRAFRAISWRLPLTWLLAPLLYVPGVPWLGNKIYLWIARNRFNLVPCDETGSCRVPPPGANGNQTNLPN